MSPRRRVLIAGAPLVVALAVAGCRDGRSVLGAGSSGPASAAGSVTTGPSAVPSAAGWQQHLLATLPHVDGATRTGHSLTAATASETWLVPPGTPACRLVLARFAAGGYRVLAGSGPDALQPGTCAAPGAGGDATTGGRGTVLAAGGSQVALSWTADTYTVTVLP